MSVTIDEVRERKRIRANLAYLMALDALDAAQARINALSHAAKRGVFNEPMHMAALGNLERAMHEIRRAEQASAGMVEEGGPDAA